MPTRHARQAQTRPGKFRLKKKGGGSGSGKGKAKPYQVKQVLQAINKLEGKS